MELRETAACGVAHREFTLDLVNPNEIKEFVRLVEAGAGVDAALAEELKGEAANAVGAGSVSIEMIDENVHKLHAMMKAASTAGGANPAFVDELAGFMQFVVGIND